jgi:hypothetical protein
MPARCRRVWEREMAKTFLPPHLIDVRGVSCCSVCRHAFDTNSKLSIGVAFRMHILDVHTAKAPSKRSRGLKQIEPTENVFQLLRGFR